MNLRFKFEPVAWVAALSTLAKAAIAAAATAHLITLDQATAAAGLETVVSASAAYFVRALVTPLAKQAPAPAAAPASTPAPPQPAGQPSPQP